VSAPFDATDGPPSPVLAFDPSATGFKEVLAIKELRIPLGWEDDGNAGVHLESAF
jgi:hypothetical protein